jgi:hypothetical protein
MNYDVFLMLKRDTQSLLFLLIALRQFYIKNYYQNALNKINESIITSNNSLMIIDRQLIALKATA